MFSAEHILDRLRQQPFPPLRIVMSSGQSYDIYHPELVMVNPRWLLVCVQSNKNPAMIEAANHVAVMHVTDLQTIPAAPRPSEETSASPESLT